MGKSMYVYRVSSDTGLAPCVDDGMLTLACCKGGWKNGVKTGLRYWIGEKLKDDCGSEEIYVMGLYHGDILYCAKIEKAYLMEDYYNGISKGRQDDIYEVINGDVVHKKGIKTHKCKDEIARDLAGVYILISEKNDFYYFGNQCFGKEEIKEILGDDLPKTRETKIINDSEKIDDVLKYIEENFEGINYEIMKPNDEGGCDKGC